MNLNIFSPGKAIEDNFDKPNVIIALVLVLVPVLLAGIQQMMMAVPADKMLASLGYNLFREYLLFFVLAILVYLVVLFKEKKTNANFAGIISAMGLLRVLTVGIAIISLFAPMIFAPQFLDAVKKIPKNATTEQIAQVTVQLNAAMPTGINMGMLMVFVIIGIILVLWELLILYKIISHISKERPGLNIVALLVILFILGIVAILI